MQLAMSFQDTVGKDIIGFAHKLSFEECSAKLTHKPEKGYEVSFAQFCMDSGEDYLYLTEKALNGVLSKVLMPLKRGCQSDYRDITPGKRAEGKLEELKTSYSLAVETGVIKEVISLIALDFNKESDRAHLRLIIRRSCQKAKRAGKLGEIHPDHHSMFA